MFNELLFLAHVAAVAGFTLFSLALGKEALTATICIFSILSNLFVTKQITLFGLDVISTDVFAVGGILGLNMLQEFFGREIIKKTIAINFVIMMLYLAMSQFQLWYQPNAFDTMHPHFDLILSPMLRIIIASVAVYVIVQIIDAYLYATLKQIFKNRYLTGRNVTSLLFSQLIDTILFSFAALYGSVESVLHIIMVSYCIKVVVIMCNAPFIAFAHRIFSRTHHHDII